MAGDEGTLLWAGLLGYPLCWDEVSPCSAPCLQKRGFLCDEISFLGSSNGVSLCHVDYSAWFTRISWGICKPGISWLSVNGFHGLRGKVLQKTKREAFRCLGALARLVSLLHLELVPFVATPPSHSPQPLHRTLLCPPRLAWVSATSPTCSVFKSVWILSSCSLWDLFLLWLWADPFPSMADAAKGAACTVPSRHCTSPQRGHSRATLPCWPWAGWEFTAASTTPHWAHLPLAFAASVVATSGSELMYELREADASSNLADFPIFSTLSKHKITAVLPKAGKNKSRVTPLGFLALQFLACAVPCAINHAEVFRLPVLC